MFIYIILNDFIYKQISCSFFKPLLTILYKNVVLQILYKYILWFIIRIKRMFTFGYKNIVMDILYYSYILIYIIYILIRN